MHSRVKANCFRDSCLKFPALIKQTFPDAIFPIQFERLHGHIMESDWQMSNDAEEGVVLLLMWLNKLTTEIARICEVGAVTHEWVVGDGEHVDLVDRRSQSHAPLATSGIIDIQPSEDGSILPPSSMGTSAQTVFSGDERRLYLGIGFSHSDVQVFGFNRSGFITVQMFNVRDDPAMLVRLIGGLMFTADVEIIDRPPAVPEVVEEPQARKPLLIVLPASKGASSAGIRGKKRKLESTEPHFTSAPEEDKENSDSVSEEPTQKPMKSGEGTRRSTRIKERVLTRSETM